MSKSRVMWDMTVEEVREGLKGMKTVIIPVGCTEQHGYHLPLSTDIHNAYEVAIRASGASGCFVTPPLNYSFSGGLLPGTINISPQLFSMLLMEMFDGLAAQGFRNIIVLLGHGGTENTKGANDAADMAQRSNPRLDGVTVLVVPFWELSPAYMKSFEEQDYHAGKYETSMMLYWHPELVRMDRARLDDPEDLDAARSAKDTNPDRYDESTRRFVMPKNKWHPAVKVGVWGHLNGPSAELGKTIAGECTQSLAAIVTELEAKICEA